MDLFKDNSVSNGQDAAFIDDILFPSGNAGGSSTELTATAFAYPAQLCMGGSGQLFAFVKMLTETLLTAGLLLNS